MDHFTGLTVQSRQHPLQMGIYELDLEGNVVAVRHAGLKQLGTYKESELLHKNYFTAVGCTNPEQIEAITSAVSAGVSCDIEFQTKSLQGDFLNYQSHFIQTASSPLIVITHDITSLQKKQVIQEGSKEVLEKLAAGKTLETVLELLAINAEKVNPEMLCSILLTDEQKTKLQHAAGPSLPAFYNRKIDGVRIGFGVGSCGTAAFTGRRVIVQDILEHPFWRDFVDLATAANLRACWSEPIIASNGEILGTFAMYFKSPRKPTLEDLTLIHSYAHLAGIAIEKKNTETRLSHQMMEHARINKELDMANAILKELVVIDALTGLLNRRGFEQTLQECIAKTSRFQESFQVLVIDLDNFKNINDKLGYRVGDQLLTKVGSIIKGCLRRYDHAARIGGDEFVVLVLNVREAEAKMIAEKIRIGIARAMVGILIGRALKITASIGMISCEEGIQSLDELLEKGWEALHRSKKAGKNKISLRRSALGTPHQKTYDLEQTLTDMRDIQNYSVLKQAIFRLREESVIGYEFLSRFTSTQNANFGPDDFFHLASEEGLLTQVDRACLKNCSMIAHYVPPRMSAHINLFPSTLIETSMQSILEHIPDRMVRSGMLCLEISEQQIIGNPEYLIDATQKLKKQGVKIAIDDVGFGSTCLESLLLLEPNVIKIDKKCVMHLAENFNKRTALKRLLKMIAPLEADVIAEGIETEADLNVLRDMGVRHGQGYYLARPSAGLPSMGMMPSSISVRSA